MKKEPIYLETGASSVGLGAGLLQVSEGMTCMRDTTPDNAILRPTSFASNCLSSAETCYSNIEREDLGIIHSV